MLQFYMDPEVWGSLTEGAERRVPRSRVIPTEATSTAKSPPSLVQGNCLSEKRTVVGSEVRTVVMRNQARRALRVVPGLCSARIPARLTPMPPER